MKISYRKSLIIRTIGTIGFLSYILYAFLIGISTSQISVQEISPYWRFFGKSNWSLLFTSSFISLLYVWANILMFTLEIGEKEKEGKQDKFNVKKLPYYIKIALNFLLCIMSFPALFTLKKIWQGYDSNYSIQWTFMMIYFEFLYLYLMASILDYTIEFITYDLDVALKRLESSLD